LPEPEAPTTATASPRVTARSISRRIARSASPLFTVLPIPRAITTLLFVAMLLFVVLLAAPVAAAEKSILVVGDSLSAAYGLPRDRGWVALLEERLKREHPDYIVVNASISGDTSGGGRARLKALLERHRPAVMILALGGNDGLRGLPPAQIRANLSAMIQDAQAQGTRVLLLGVKMPPNYGEDYTKGFEAIFRDVAKTHRTALVPFLLEDFAEKPEFFQPDRIHPTEAAQPLMLERVWPALKPLLR
jgi:acyl-CoA thioesterase-1